MAAAAVSLGAYALEPQVIAMGNADFESLGTKTDESGAEVSKGKGDKLEEGWEQVGSSDWFSYANYNKAHSEDPDLVAHEGNWYVRCVNTSAVVPAGTYIMQEVAKPGIGVYALTADVVVSRNSCKGGLTDAQFGFLFLGDNDSDIDDPEDPGYLKVFQTNKTEQATNEDGTPKFDESGAPVMVPVQDYSRKTVRVIIESEAKRGGLTVAFGIPTASEGISKGWLECDTFVLEYFGEDATIDEVKAYYDELTAVEGIEAEEVAGDNYYYTIDGIRLDQPNRPGLYIHNGKKIIVK